MISPSQISCYINCSKKYYYRYIVKEKSINETNFDGLLIGKTVHEIINYYFRHKKDNYLDYMIWVFFRNIPKYCFTKELDEYLYFDNNYNTYIEIMKKYLKPEYHYLIYEKQEFLKTKVNIYSSLLDICKSISQFVINEIKNGLLSNYINFETEKQIEYNNLHGFCDLIGITKDFQKFIIDFKISKKDYKFQKKVQDMLYSYIIWKSEKQIPIFEYIAIKYSERKLDDIVITRQIFQYNEKDFEIIEDTIENFQKGVENGVFLRNEESFLCSRDYCEYFDICQSYKYTNEEK